MNEFAINDFISLKLEGGKTNIYVKGERFDQCKYLMITIPIEESKKFDEIDSIDEAADMIGWTSEEKDGIKYEINSKTEFWGHCSNLQVWCEHDYDTRFLHSNLSFPLLIKLAEVGDPIAKKIFKEEIAKRFESGYPTVITCIIEEGLLDYLNSEERMYLIEQTIPIILKSIENYSKYLKIEIFDILISFSKKTELLEKNFPVYLDTLDKLPNQIRCKAFCELIHSVNTNVWNKYNSQIEAQFLSLLNKLDYDGFNRLLEMSTKIGCVEELLVAFLKAINNLRIKNKYSAFSILLNVAKETGLVIEYFTSFLDTVEKFHDAQDGDRHDSFSSLIKSIKNTELLNEIINKYYSQIEPLFLDLLNSIDKLPSEKRYRTFADLYNSIRNTKLMKNHTSQLNDLFLETLGS